MSLLFILLTGMKLFGMLGIHCLVFTLQLLYLSHQQSYKVDNHGVYDDLISKNALIMDRAMSAPQGSN